MMKSPGEQKEESVSTTTITKNKTGFLCKKNNQLFENINKLEAYHDVTVSCTMIKVSYKKALKEHYVSSACENGVDFNKDSVLIENNMNTSTNKSGLISKANNTVGTTLNLSEVNSSDFLLVPNTKKNSNSHKSDNNSPVFHSTPKQCIEIDKKKREYVNGLNLVVKPNDFFVKNLASSNRNHVVHNIVSSEERMKKKITAQKGLSLKYIEKNHLGKKVISTGKNKNLDEKSSKGTAGKSKDSISGRSELVGENSGFKKAATEFKKKPPKSNTVVKENESVNQGIKRKLKIKEIAIPNKKLKKSEANLLEVRKRLSNSAITVTLTKTKVKPSENNSNKEQKISEIGKSGVYKKELLWEDPDLPFGWKRVIHTRYEGTPNEKRIVYVFSPQGKKFQYKWKLRKYLEKIGSPLNADYFHFGLYKRNKALDSSEERRQEVSKELSSNQTVAPKAKSCMDGKSIPINKSTNNRTKTKFSSSKSSSVVTHNVFDKDTLKSEDNDDSKEPKYDEYTENYVGASSVKAVDSEGRQLLLHDPDLPFGWKRIINTKSSTGKLQVHIISPEGRIFRRRYRLNEYLLKHQYTHSMDRFYFGLYPKKENNAFDSGADNSKAFSDDMEGDSGSDIVEMGDERGDFDFRADEGSSIFNMVGNNKEGGVSPMYDDPNLPEGWKRYIKIRSCGETAGRMEVVIVSPDGRRHRSKGQLEQYFLQNNLNYNADDFDFTVFGKNRKRSFPVSSNTGTTDFSLKRKPKESDRPVPDFDINSVKDVLKLTPEGEMINMVSGLMVTCNLSSSRSERRLRLPRKEHEKILKDYLNSENEISDGCDIPTNWVQRLVKCRSDIGVLEPDAAAAIAERTRDFVQELALRAFESSQIPEAGLHYDDLAEFVEKTECLSPLRTLIPRKITFRDYLRLNRPKHFMSYT